MNQVRRVALAARVFTLAAVAAAAGLLGSAALRGLVAVFVLAVLGQALSSTRRLPEAWVAVLEGAATAVFVLWLAPHQDAVLPYLVTSVLIGGLDRRLLGVARVFSVEAVVLAGGFALFPAYLSRPVAAQTMAWMVVGLGLGLLGASVHRLLAETVTETSYRSAVELIGRLHEISGRLSDGLDLVSIADGVLARVDEHVPIRSAALFTRTHEGRLVALRSATGTSPQTLTRLMQHVELTWTRLESTQKGRSITVPLTREGQIVAVLAAQCLRSPDPADVLALDRALSGETLKLYAAMLFSEVRDAATHEERLRLAREVHDGIAQDVASLGYLLDNVDPQAGDLAGQLSGVRGEITRVVAELRHSVFDLRTDVATGRGLGESLSTLARHIGARSTMTIHVTLDEAPSRLRPEVESELLRIAQEAMNNARKHSGAQNLWLSCRVQPPQAEIVVRDDGDGLGRRGGDSHGLLIMRERANRIGSGLEVVSPAVDGRGTLVRVCLGAATR